MTTIEAATSAPDSDEEEATAARARVMLHGSEPLGNRRPDIAKSDQPHGGAGEIVNPRANQLGGGELPGAARLLALRQPLDERQHQHQRLFGHSGRVHPGVIGDRDAGTSNCRDVDRVIPDPDQLG